MGFKETLHKIVHHEEFDHRPSLEELKESPLIGGDILDKYPEGEGQEIELFNPLEDEEGWIQ